MVRQVAGDYLPACNRDTATPLGLLAVQSRAQANQRGAVCTDVVFIRAELATLGSDTLQLLLSRGVGVANVHEERLLANADAVELANNFIANVARFKAARRVSTGMIQTKTEETNRAKPTPRLFPMLSRRILLDKIVYPRKMVASSYAPRQ